MTDIDELVEARIAPIREAIARRNEELDDELETAETRKWLITEAVTREIDPRAIPDFVASGLETWRLEDGHPVARDGDGNRLLSRWDSRQPMGFEEWIRCDASHLLAKPGTLH